MPHWGMLWGKEQNLYFRTLPTVQWGMVPIGASSFTVTFPISFSSAVYSITNATIVSVASQSYGTSVADVTLSSFTLRRWDTNRGAYWKAVGK